MNRRAGSGLVLSVLLAACQPASDQPELKLGDLDDYTAFLEARDKTPEPEPFQARPLQVGARGEVRAAPDIAVITALIRAEDRNESAAVDTMGRTINAVQDALSDYDLETGFTDIRSTPRYAETCENHNREAIRRHRQIVSDYNYNQNQKNRGFTDVTFRPDRPRIAQRVCRAQEIRVETEMVLRISPADAAGDVLSALGNAQVERAQLVGYDFSNYDALYSQAAERAVDNARAKAETIATTAGGSLGELAGFSITPPARQGRFGPQPSVIRPKRPILRTRPSPLSQIVNPPLIYCPDGVTRVVDYDLCPRMAVNLSGSFTAGRSAPIVSKSETMAMDNGDVVVMPAADTETVAQGLVASEPVAASGGRSNALSMSLLSGPQVIDAYATLSFRYDTPVTGKIIVPPEPK